jgi:hypothetical protein
MTTPTASPAVHLAERIAKPNCLELCDRCGANALWRLRVAGGELLFCGHHAVKAGLVKIDTSHTAYQTDNRQKGSAS